MVVKVLGGGRKRARMSLYVGNFFDRAEYVTCNLNLLWKLQAAIVRKIPIWSRQLYNLESCKIWP